MIEYKQNANGKKWFIISPFEKIKGKENKGDDFTYIICGAYSQWKWHSTKNNQSPSQTWANHQ
jgi:hypothetical protein